MNTREKRLIEENMKAIEIRAKYLFKKYGSQHEEYDEYFQNACLMVCNKIHKYDGSTEFSTFVDAILENAFIDLYRMNGKNKPDVLSLDECCSGDDDCDVTLRDFLADKKNTENEVIARITETVVSNCIDKARMKCTSKTTVRGFDALELKIKGYTGTEIAKIFNVPTNSLRAWISRAKKELLREREFADLIKRV